MKRRIGCFNETRCSCAVISKYLQCFERTSMWYYKLRRTRVE